MVSSSKGDFVVHPDIVKHARHNFIFNVLDGAFFGWGMGFASTVTIIPLFIATLTDSTTLIGLAASFHVIGWQIPQLFTAGWVSGMSRLKPTCMRLGMLERSPYFALALTAALIPTVGKEIALILAVFFLILQGLGGGAGATPWQTLISKIITLDRRGTFYGVLMAAVSLMQSAGAIIAGILLYALPSPLDFALCFLFGGLSLMISWFCIAQTREPATPAAARRRDWRTFRQQVVTILRDDKNFRWFLVVRALSQFAVMAIAFYTVYGVRRFQMEEQMAGFLVGVLMLAQTIASPLLGWLGDRRSHREMFALGMTFAAASALLAFFAPSLNWFYAIFFLSGIGNTVTWGTTLTLTAEFGTDANRPYYIGMANTLVAPATIAAPIVGGWLADAVGFEATFAVAAIGGILTSAVLLFAMIDPRKAPTQAVHAAASAD